jgi:hypothetical protein
MNTATQTPRTFRPGDRVTYMGKPATVVHGNEAAPEWGLNEPSQFVNIRFDKAPRGVSPQQDVYATSILPAEPRTAVADVLAVTIAGRVLTLDDAVNASAILAEVSAGHEDGADRLARACRLDGLTNDELETLCAAFGVEF